MKLIVWTLSILVVAGTIASVSCITNREFLELVLPYTSDIEEVDDDSDAIDEADDVIHLPGNMDDELDVAYIFEKLGVLVDNDVNDDLVVFPRGSIAYPWLQSDVKQQQQQQQQRKLHKRQQRPLELQAGCRCTKDECSCCASHTFAFPAPFKKFRKSVEVCVGIQIQQDLTGVEFSIKLNGRQLYNHQISLSHPPRMCVPFPGTMSRIKVCVGLYDVNLQTKHVCVAIYGVLSVVVKKFEIRFKLGCFKIPILDKDAFLLLTRDPDFFRVTRLDAKQTRDSVRQQSRYILGYLQEEEY